MPVAIDRSLQLPDGEFLSTQTEKSGIAVHHTVGGTARSTFEWWLEDTRPIGTAYLIDRDGTVHELFEPSSWAWQFGLRWPDPHRIDFERRFIGIEIASEGGLTEHEGQLYCFDRISPRTRKSADEAFDFGQDYRGYRFFDRYEEAQLDALVELVDDLCEEFDVPRSIPEDPLDFHGRRLAGFRGVIGHNMVRRDKTDPLPDISLWERVAEGCGASFAGEDEVGSEDPVTPEGEMDEAEIDRLFEHNVQEIDRMDVAAGSMVKALIIELERDGRDTYIRLHDAEPDGHAVAYDFVQGRRDLVGRIAGALGFETVTDARLVVRGG